MISSYEEMVENIKAFDDAQGMDNGQLAAAVEEVEKARKQYNSLLEEALENPELAAEVTKAQGMVTILETKLERLQAKMDAEKKPYPDGMAVAFMNVKAEIRRKIQNGSLLCEKFQPMLDEMKEHMQAYSEKMGAVLVKMHQVNKSLAHIQHSTASAVLRYTGKEESFSIMGPEQVTESDFKEWAWVDYYQYANDLAAIRMTAMEETSPEGKLPPVRMLDDVITPKSENFQKANPQ